MNILAPTEQNENKTEKIDIKSMTALSKEMLAEPAGVRIPKTAKVVETDTESVYEVAAMQHMTLRTFVEQDADYALAVAEKCYARWTNISNAALFNGGVETPSGFITFSTGQYKLLESRVAQARKELGDVQDLIAVMPMPGEKRRDHVIRMLYVNAVLRKDTKALTYLIDRVEGRPVEARAAELDYDNAYNIYMIIHTLFDKQLQVLNAGNGTILICCSRRAGKTHLLVAAALIECLRKSNTKCIYIGETMELTEELVDSAMNEIIQTCNLRDKKGRPFNWRHMDNGSKILVRGLSNTKDPDQIRGNKAKVIVIDEFFHLKSDLLEYLQREVLQPMQMDYADDYKFICAGTPPQIKGTYGENAWKTWEVPHFQWTWRDNPHPVDIAAREAYVENVLAEKGLTWDSPFARREYNGEWAYDDDLLLYPNVHTYNPIDSIPQYNITRVMFGIDYGVSDSDAIIGIAWSGDEQKGFQFYEAKFNRYDIKDKTISQLEYLKSKVYEAWDMALQFFPNMSKHEANKRILWDADSNDQHITQELCMSIEYPYVTEEGEEKKLSLDIRNAHKTDKKTMWDKIDDCMRTGRLLLMAESKVVHECMSTILLRGKNGEIFNEIDEGAYHPDLLPALRYAMWNAIGCC